MADHGTITKYTYGKCRCDECRAANAKTQRLARERRKNLTVAGGLPTAVVHGASAYTNHGCRCEACTKAHTERCATPSKEWAARNSEVIRVTRRRQHHRAQALTMPTATRLWQPWTGPELELASRIDLSARQVALMIGRTYAAVASMRRKLRYDPKTINLAGVNPSVADR